eukprot:8007248-Ditylum_brightwellii.AAC.1
MSQAEKLKHLSEDQYEGRIGQGAVGIVLGKYTITTTFGTSKHTNWFNKLASIFSIGQGAADRPLGWGAIIKSILKVHKYLATGCTIRRIQQNSTPSLKTNANAFVNDATLLHNTENFNKTAINLMNQVQHDAGIWGRILWVAGGLLEFLKSSYFLLIWDFNEDGAPFIVDETDLPANTIKLVDAAGHSTNLKRFSPNKGIKMLGSHKAATLQDNAEFDYILEKAEQFLCALLPCYLQQHDVWTASMTIYHPSITYSLCSISFIKKQIDKLQSQLLLHLLPKLGYQHNFPYTVVFGSKYAG